MEAKRGRAQRLNGLVCVPLLASVMACSAPSTDGADSEGGAIRTTHQQQTGQSFVDVCNQDPRVWMGLVSLDVCVGARLFFDETFEGNGRTCGSCHPAGDNFTVDAESISALDPSDALFVFEDPSLGIEGLETDHLRASGLIKENIDGFQDNDFRFVSRSVQHVFSLATSITRDPADGTSADFVERTGWSGDGSPGDGSLRQFANGAIKQHFPTDLEDRTDGVAFRLASETELDQMLAFQLALGRTADIDLNDVTLTDQSAMDGIAAFSDPERGRCNTCHENAGANFELSGLNRNFDTGVTEAPNAFIALPDGTFLFDGGFGGQDLTEPNHVTVTGQPDALGDGTFSTPPIIEAADTAPFFHTHNFPTLEGAVAFYATSLFQDSPAKAELDLILGTEVMNITADDINDIGRMLRVLNASFNLAMAEQRLQAAHDLSSWFWTYRDDVSFGLIELAAAEVEDALSVLETTTSLHPSEQAMLSSLLTLLGEAGGESNPAIRIQKTTEALADIDAIASGLGSGIEFELGSGNLMF